MYFVKVESNVKIAVYDINPDSYCKNEDVLFFIHGWPLNHNMFEYQYDVLPKNGFRCISMDIRGFGNSDAPWSGYSYDRLCDDVYEVIKSLNVRSLILVGFGMGGAIAIRYMARHREYKVSKLCLLAAAAPSFTKRENYPYGMSIDDMNVLITGLYKDRPKTVADFCGKFFENPVSPNFTDWWGGLAYDASGHGTIHCAETLRDSDLRRDLECIKVPTGIFHGVLDKICPFVFAEILNAGIKNSTLFKFDKCGHAVFYDELDNFNKQFIDFCSN